MPNHKYSRNVCLEKIHLLVQSDHYVANRSCRILTIGMMIMMIILVTIII